MALGIVYLYCGYCFILIHGLAKSIKGGIVEVCRRECPITPAVRIAGEGSRYLVHFGDNDISGTVDSPVVLEPQDAVWFVCSAILPFIGR